MKANDVAVPLTTAVGLFEGDFEQSVIDFTEIVFILVMMVGLFRKTRCSQQQEVLYFQCYIIGVTSNISDLYLRLNLESSNF
jgi:hypothetical protein